MNLVGIYYPVCATQVDLQVQCQVFCFSDLAYSKNGEI